MSDALATHFPVSIKGVIVADGRVILLKNEREEWELPGGKLEAGETPEVCLVREIHEELSVRVTVDNIIDVWVYPVTPATPVVIITYGCTLLSPVAQLVLSHEHKQLATFPLAEVSALPMPDGYKRSLARWATFHR